MKLNAALKQGSLLVLLGLVAGQAAANPPFGLPPGPPEGLPPGPPSSEPGDPTQPSKMETACYVAGSIGGQASYLTLTATRLSQITPESVVGTDQGIGDSVVPFQTLYSLNGKAYSDSGVITGRTVQFNAVAGTAVVAEDAGVLMSFTGVQGVNLADLEGASPSRLTDVISLATSCTSADPMDATVFPDTLTCRTIAIEIGNVFNPKAPEFSAAEFTLQRTDLEDTEQCSFLYVPEDSEDEV